MIQVPTPAGPTAATILKWLVKTITACPERQSSLLATQLLTSTSPLAQSSIRYECDRAGLRSAVLVGDAYSWGDCNATKNHRPSAAVKLSLALQLPFWHYGFMDLSLWSMLSRRGLRDV